MTSALLCACLLLSLAALPQRCSSNEPASSGGCMVSAEAGELQFGEVRLVSDGSDCSGASGELQYVIQPDDGWSSVCYENFGYLDGQVVCEQLGFHYISSVYEITEPAPTSSGSVITNVTCSPPVEFAFCNRVQISGAGCLSTVGIVCNATQMSSENYTLILVSELLYGRNFILISPADELYIKNLISTVHFCYGPHYLDRNNANVRFLLSHLRQLQAIGTGDVMGDVHLPTFGVDCDPVYGETYVGNFRNSGPVYFYTDEFIGVCSNTFGYLEAQVACTRSHYPFVSELFAVDSLSDPLQVISSLSCHGNETSIAQCEIMFANVTACQQIAAVQCAGQQFGSTAGQSLLAFNNAPPYAFTLIVPDEDVYLHLQDCNLLANDTGNETFCPGAHAISSTNFLVQQMILIASSLPNGTEAHACAEFSNISAMITFELLGIECPPVTLASTTTTVVTANTTSISPAIPESGNDIAVVSGAVAAVLVAVLALGAVLAAVIAVRMRRYHRNKNATMATRNFLNELLEANSLTKRMPSEDVPQFLLVRKQHKTVCRRKSSALNRITDTDWEIPFACITFKEEVGAGAYGSIHRAVIACEHQQEQIEVAVKMLKKDALESERRTLKLEINMMKDIGYHRHVVSMLACCTKTEPLALIMEYVPFGNLQSYLKKHRHNNSEDVITTDGEAGRSYNKYTKEFSQSYEPSTTPQQQRMDSAVGGITLVVLLQFARQITLGMEYLASLKIVHRDLAARNILIDQDMVLKVSDFGLSRDIYSDNCYHMESVKDRLPVRWMPMESIVDREFTTASDVWSFGITLWEIMTYASFPYCHMTNTEVIDSIKKGYKMPQPDDCPDQVYAIMTACWQSRTSLRPSFTDIRAMLDTILDTGEYMALLDSKF